MSRAVWFTASVLLASMTGLHAAQAPVEPAPLDRSLLDTYCVTCHNERLRIAGLTLDTVDISRVGVHAELLEKVVGKLRKGQMPPAGLRGGRHIRYPGTPLANLWRIVLSKMGIPVDQIGDSAGPLDHLTDV